MKIAYRVFLAIVFLSTMLEADGNLADPVAQLGADFHSDLTNLLHVHVIVSLFEIGVLVCVILWFSRGQRLARTLRFERGTLIVPALVFAGVMLFCVLYGLGRGGATLTEALWEVRGFMMMLVAYALVGMFIRSEREANHLTWVLLIAPTLLAIENIYRALAFSSLISDSDLAYDHTDSVMLGCALLLCLAILTYGGTSRQRRFTMAAIPIITISLLLMKRRAAFPVVGIGIIVLIIFLLRLRPRLFWKYVPPIVVLTAIYLVIFWNNTSAIGQPARAISSQFTPDPRDVASNLYRVLEKTDILANIQQATVTGLGFGQPFKFYVKLPDLSWWPFWHFETHNAILWVWMKAGLVGFLAFWWLLGRGAYDGSRTVETQREEWALVAELRKRFSRRGAAVRSESDSRKHALLYRATGGPTQQRRRGKHAPRLGLNVPAWERSDDKNSLTAQRSAALALLVVAVCMIPMQVVYSYVDLGLTSERDMFLFGLMLGVIARGYSLLGISNIITRASGRKRGARAGARVADGAADAAPSEGADEEAASQPTAPHLAPGLTGTGPRATKVTKSARTRQGGATLAASGGATLPRHSPPLRTTSSSSRPPEAVGVMDEPPLPWEITPTTSE